MKIQAVFGRGVNLGRLKLLAGGPPDAASGVLAPYVTRLYQTLAVFRFVSFALGVGLLLGSNTNTATLLMPGFVAIVVGFYNIGRIVAPPLSRWSTPWMETILVLVDALLSVPLVLVTGGLDSPFLVYSLVPTLSTSLFMSRTLAAVTASLSALPIVGAHALAVVGIGKFPSLFLPHYLVFGIFYVAGYLLVLSLPFLSNLNWHRRLQMMAEQTERERLRREVHDEVAQTLAFLSLKLQRAEARVPKPEHAISPRDLRDIAMGVQRCYLAVRDYLDSTEEVAIQPLGARLVDMARQWEQDTGLTVDIFISGREWEIPSISARHLVQIVREALSNVGKHASPSSVRMELLWTTTGVTMCVRDDGQGFSTAQTHGHGLNIMRERASLIGATLSILSAPSRGTEVVVMYPYKEKGESSGPNQGSGS